MSADDVNWAALLRWCDGNGDGRLTRAEWNRLTQLWVRMDADKDGNVSAREAEQVPRIIAEMEAARAGAGSTGQSRPDPAEPSGNRRPARTSATTSGGGGQASTPGGGGIEGVWRGAILNQQGNNEMEVELTVSGNRIEGREQRSGRPMQDLGSGTYTITGNGSGTLDADGTGGPQEGRHFMGIYELNGNTLRWCVSNRGRQRPDRMATDRGNYLLVLQRQ